MMWSLLLGLTRKEGGLGWRRIICVASAKSLGGGKKIINGVAGWAMAVD